MALVLAASGTIGAKALYLFIAWLLGATFGAYLSERKGYGNKIGLASGLILSLAGAVIWLFVPARSGSDWKIKGPWGDELKDKQSPPPPAPAAPDS